MTANKACLVYGLILNSNCTENRNQASHVNMDCSFVSPYVVALKTDHRNVTFLRHRSRRVAGVQMISEDFLLNVY